MMKVAVKQGGRAVEWVGPARALPGDDLRAGDPVMVGVLDDGERPRIFEITRRHGGMRFDCLDEVAGVIDHQNRDKALASVYLAPDRVCLLPYRDFPSAENWAPGTPVRVHYVSSNNRLRSYHAALWTMPISSSIRRAEGIIALHAGGYGFVDEVFVPPRVAQAYCNGQHISLVAVIQPNKKTGRLGWVAVGAGD
jgi:hypothetical protein